jgi:hypothetical protein
MITLISLLLSSLVIEGIGSKCDKSESIGCYWGGPIRDLLIVFNAVITWGAQWPVIGEHKAQKVLLISTEFRSSSCEFLRAR